MAAGQSARFRAAGGSEATKLVAKLDGKPIVRIVAETALASRASPVVVVVGHARNSVEAALAGLDIGIAFNSAFASGLASSLNVGLSAMPPDAVGAVVLLGDMPRVQARLIDALIDAFLSQEGALAAAPSLGGRRGNPVLLGRGLFEGAMGLTATRARAGSLALSARASWSKSPFPTLEWLSTSTLQATSPLAIRAHAGARGRWQAPSRPRALCFVCRRDEGTSKMTEGFSERKEDFARPPAAPEFWDKSGAVQPVLGSRRKP